MKKEFNYLFEILFVVINVLIVTFFYKNILLTTTLLLLITIIGLIKWKSKRTLIIFIIVAISGAFAEMFCIYIGVWKYTITNFVNIPFWLFIVWGNAAAVIYQVAKKIKERRMNLI